MCNQDLILGIDTSNYKTSLALTSHSGEIVIDSRKSLVVKQGERGLRQSHALFQHMENLPEMIETLLQQVKKERIGAIAVSDRPRPVEGSYMPVFKAGIQFGRVLASCLNVPIFEFSHQEGHLEAVKHGSSLEHEKEYLAYHLSGGTCELLLVKGASVEIIGSSKDISFGQVIDRIGVALQMDFPAGMEMDKLALLAKKSQSQNSLNCGIRSSEFKLKRIPLDGLSINLSGLETECQRKLEHLNSENKGNFIYELFQIISICLCQLTEKAVLETNCSKILFSGGVSSSIFIREEIMKYFTEKKVDLVFGNPVLSSDNAVGISFLGGKKLWQ
jgi:N6-L-threonylcarbamoyladenine synthase